MGLTKPGSIKSNALTTTTAPFATNAYGLSKRVLHGFCFGFCTALWQRHKLGCIGPTGAQPNSVMGQL